MIYYYLLFNLYIMDSISIISDIFSPSFWEKDSLNLLHVEDNLIIVGNDTSQLLINIISFDDTFFPIIKEDIPTEHNAFINIQFNSLKLEYHSNRIKFKNIIKRSFHKKNIPQISKNNFDIYLNNNTIKYKFHNDFDSIKNIQNNIYNSCNKLKLLVGKINPLQTIIKEIKLFNSDLTFPHYIEIYQNNPFKPKFHIFKNNTHKIIIQLDLDSKYYPLLPPKIKWISPVISKNDLAAFINCNIFKSDWNPIIDFKWLTKNILSTLVQREKTLNTTIFSDKNTYFSEEDILIFNFLKTIGRFNTSNPITIKFNKSEIIDNTKSYWKKGTGYSHHGLESWSLDDYLKKQSNIQNEIITYLDSILDMTISQKNIPHILQNCFIEVSGITFLDIQKNYTLFIKYLNIINKYYSDKYYSDIVKLTLDNFNELIEDIHISQETDDNTIYIKNIIQQIIQKINIKNTCQKINTTTYTNIMKPLQFQFLDISTTKFTFSKKIGKPSSKLQIKRIAQEISSLKKSLPLNIDSTVWIRWDKVQLNKMQFMISGPKDTPYQDGLFLFDLYFPPSYPTDPPKVILQTTGNGSVRFNPNLYDCGKVCLSLLGTWNSDSQAEKWNDKTSTILQVLVSIQSLILIEDPYFNEPGYQKDIGTKRGNIATEKYNHHIRQATARWAIHDMIENPPIGFKEIIKQHFTFKKNIIKDTLTKWAHDTTKIEYSNTINNTIKIINIL